MTHAHFSMKEALEKKSKELEAAAIQLKWRIKATPLSDGTLRIHTPLTEIEKMCQRIREMADRIDHLEMKQKMSPR
ncbi:Uncharacterised protein [uncultured archaeon]|nr:Uncharacterised protein [uncultured archaeon]